MPPDKLLSRKRNIDLLAILLISLLGFSIYAGSLSGQFIWDDHLLIKENRCLESWKCAPMLFTGTTTAGVGESRGFYRPLQMLSYMLNYSLWGLNTGGYHLTNIILQVLVALSVYYLTKLIFSQELIALFTGVFFVAHPIHSEAVAYISGRADPLATLFLLLCFICYTRNLQARNFKIYLLLFFTYLAALLSKESSLILPGLILLYHYTFRRKIEPAKFGLILAITFCYAILRFFIFRHSLPYTLAQGNSLQRLPGFFVAIAGYIRLLFMPFGLHMEYGKKIFSMHDPRVVLGFTLSVVLLAVAFVARYRNKPVSFSIFWFFLTLLPYSNLYALNAFMAEHWLYLPSIGFFWLISAGLSALCKNGKLRIIGIGLSAGLVIFYACLTATQSRQWNDNTAFFERNLKYSPDSARLYYNLGLSYDLSGRAQEAIKAYKKSIEIDPDYFLAHNNLAVVYYEGKEYALAIEHCDKALQSGYPVHPGFLELLKPYRKNLDQADK